MKRCSECNGSRWEASKRFSDDLWKERETRRVSLSGCKDRRQGVDTDSVKVREIVESIAAEKRVVS